ncbi:acetamidase/formamidase family protein [Deinococcus deserti]|uniref:Putative acetamidase/formamidase family protein n=1 Tax=Deinococcus deserti (strain DSM 17065 / CIP 109153 / LMG 22923 / VCD115) TaxID=546414 RepID=C1D2F8_DEIDV|nr:putative acetamidase/formamidase family protein [Deinococcus deserti VCD115]
MTIIPVPAERLIYAMDRSNAPLVTVPDGSVLTFETRDCFEDQIQDAGADFVTLDWTRVNPATGPVFVEGAQPGDALAVEIQHIEIGSQAVMVTGPGLGVEGDVLEHPTVRVYPINDGHITMGAVKIPVQPMIGVIGTAPAGDPVPNGTPGPHGGNMDTRLIQAGTTLLLPVEVEGGLLAMGDLHAAMGDGEVSVCGLEVPGRVTVRVRVVPQCRWPLPMLHTDTHVYTIASAVTLDEAAVMATKQMSAFVQAGTGLSPADAIGLLSAAGNLQISQVVDPLKTCRFELSLDILSALGFTPERDIRLAATAGQPAAD